MSQNSPFQPIVTSLRGLVRRARSLILLRGTLIITGIGIAAMLVAMALDATFSPEGIWRWILTGSVALILLVTAIRFVLMPWKRRISLKEMSLVYDARHEQSAEAITSAVHFAEDVREGSLTGSEALASQVVKQAIGEAETVRPASEFRLKAVWKPFAFASVFLGILVGLWAAWPYHVTRLLVRVMNPTSSYGNLHALNMRVTPGNGWVAEGAPVEISLILLKDRGDSAMLHREPLSGGSVTVEPMTPVSDAATTLPTFTLTFPHVTEAFRYRIVSDRSVSDLYQLDVRPYPTLHDLRFACVYPSYTGQEASTVKALEEGGEVSGIVGTQVTLRAGLDQPLDEAALLLPADKEVKARLRETESGAWEAIWQVTLAPELNGTWQYRLRDEMGLETTSEAYFMISRVDEAPVMEIVSPSENLVEANPHEQLTLRYKAQDDLELKRVKLLVNQGGDRDVIERTQPLNPADDEGVHHGEVVLDLRKYQLERFEILEFTIEGYDSLPETREGPNVGRSNALVVQLPGSGEEKTLEVSELAQQELESALHHLRNALAHAKEEDVESLKQELENAEAHLAVAAEEAKEQGNEDLEALLDSVLSEELAAAESMAQEGTPQAAQAPVASAIQKLEGALPPAGPPMDLGELAELQQELAEQAQEMAEIDPNAPLDPDWQEAQQELAEAMEAAQNPPGPP